VNPFALPGPQFLAFYAALGVVLLVGLRLLRGLYEGGQDGQVTLQDPYLIAHLRGGPEEALRVATLSLIDRGFLEDQVETLKVADPEKARLVRRPIEKAILERFGTGAPAHVVFDDLGAQRAAEGLQRDLERAGVLPDESVKRGRRAALIVALVIVLGVAGLRVAQAFSRGRYNVGFLVVLALLFGGLSALAVFRRRTARGDALLADIRQLFSGLKQRAHTIRPGGSTAEVALLAAVFGVAALPASRFGYAHNLGPKKPESARSEGASCGSSCSSSSSGSSCGSSCGGGGGGCGGCGGG